MTSCFWCARFAAAVEWGINTLGKALADALPPHGGGDSGGGGGSGGGGSGAGGSSSGDDSGGGGASGADGGRHSGDVPHWLTLFGESAIVAMSAAVLALGTTLYTRIKFQVDCVPYAVLEFVPTGARPAAHPAKLHGSRGARHGTRE